MGRHFIPTYDGKGIVALFDGGAGRPTCSPWTRSIPEAERALQQLRRDAWNDGINVFLEMANDMADALTLAAELRAEAEAKHKKEAA